MDKKITTAQRYKEDRDKIAGVLKERNAELVEARAQIEELKGLPARIEELTALAQNEKGESYKSLLTDYRTEATRKEGELRKQVENLQAEKANMVGRDEVTRLEALAYADADKTVTHVQLLTVANNNLELTERRLDDVLKQARKLGLVVEETGEEDAIFYNLSWPVEVGSPEWQKGCTVVQVKTWYGTKKYWYERASGTYYDHGSYTEVTLTSEQIDSIV